jgi:hypothetical protein
VEELLAGGLAVLPLAPLGAIRPDRLPEVIRSIETRLEHEGVPRTTVDEVWASTMLLLGLRYDRGAVRDLVRRLPHMRESISYQMILEEGREEGELRLAHGLVLELGTDRFGDVDSETSNRLERINSLETLRCLIRSVYTVGNWQELLALADER